MNFDEVKITGVNMNDIDCEKTSHDNKKELEELIESIDKIKKKYYSGNVKIKRIESQSFAKALGLRMPKFLQK